jgi:hypothetical protein
MLAGGVLYDQRRRFVDENRAAPRVDLPIES